MLTPNAKIQNYRLIRKLGEGGMGEVWLAEHLTIDRKVAIKVLHAQYARNPKIQQRFRNEAATLSKLKHPNIVTLHDFIESDADIYLVMEYVEGRNLEEIVRTETGPMPTEMLKRVFQQILSAVGYAHQQGVVHRDIKPSNFMMGTDGVVKVLDFGIAKLLEDDQQLTRTGMRMGTTFYMSPEQVNTEAVDHRSDIYSLGVTLFFLATGKAPYEGETSEYKVFDMIVQKPLPSGRTVYVGMSPMVEAVIARATEKEAGKRFQGWGEFLEGFEGSAANEVTLAGSSENPIWRRRWGIIGILALIMISAILISLKVNESNYSRNPSQETEIESGNDYDDSSKIAEKERRENNSIEEAENVTKNNSRDIDGDGIVDSNDKCPDLSGTNTAKGCPDRDKDGIEDLIDRCADIRGGIDNQGCPYNDLDFDGDVDVPSISFSLNGDGDTDIFHVDYNGTEPYRIRIYHFGSQNSNPIYESNSAIGGWDGMDSKGHVVANDFYPWVINIGDREYHGDIFLWVSW